jgi:hypothetical protein
MYGGRRRRGSGGMVPCILNLGARKTREKMEGLYMTIDWHERRNAVSLTVVLTPDIPICIRIGFPAMQGNDVTTQLG